MSTMKYDTVASLKPGRYDYKIRVRVTKKWRGSTRTGEVFKGFNILLLDHMRSRIHAFIPGLCAEELEDKISVGNIYSIKNFTVQVYKQTDIYRCLRNDKQLIFSKDTTIEELEDNGKPILTELFDFVDHSEITILAEQKTYLADVVGIIKKKDFRELHNQSGRDQKQAKLTITDGSSNVKVTFWDDFAGNFKYDFNRQVEKPVIIIISGGKIGKWNGEVEIGNVAPTTIYLNHNHHSVQHLRKRLSQHQFAEIAMNIPEKKKPELLTLNAITKLGKEYIEGTVFAHINIKNVDDTSKWFFNTCTTCDKPTEWVKELNVCNNCQRTVPHPDKKYKITVTASDATGVIDIILGDREVRTLIGKRSRDLLKQQSQKENFPQCLKDLAKKPYTVEIKIREINVVDHYQLYWAKNICNGFVQAPDEIIQTSCNTQPSTSQATSSTYHLKST